MRASTSTYLRNAVSWAMICYPMLHTSPPHSVCRTHVKVQWNVSYLYYILRSMIYICVSTTCCVSCCFEQFASRVNAHHNSCALFKKPSYQTQTFLFSSVISTLLVVVARKTHARVHRSNHRPHCCMLPSSRKMYFVSYCRGGGGCSLKKRARTPLSDAPESRMPRSLVVSAPAKAGNSCIVCSRKKAGYTYHTCMMVHTYDTSYVQTYDDVS